MKTFRIHYNDFRCMLGGVLTVMAMLLCCIDASAQEPFPGLSQSPNIESSYISGYMMRQMNQNPLANFGAFDFAGEITDMYVYRSRSGAEMVEDVREYLKKNPELKKLLSTTNQVQATSIYGKSSKKNADKFTEMLIWNNTQQSCEVVVIRAEEGKTSSRGSEKRKSAPSNPVRILEFVGSAGSLASQACFNSLYSIGEMGSIIAVRDINLYICAYVQSLTDTLSRIVDSFNGVTDSYLDSLPTHRMLTAADLERVP